ncbi:MAG TPA: DUF5655 domain-containing protein [Pseudonocardiaceae bacterium]|jgi:hypothetical protein
MRTWEPMRQRIHAQLERQTSRGVAQWNADIAKAEPPDQDALRAWLTEHDVTGYPQMLLVWETFGYPDFLAAGSDELIGNQYADRQHLRPIFDAVIAAVSGFDGIEVQARKTYVALLSPRRTFGIVKASTKTRIDVGLRLSNPAPHGRLLPAKSLGNDTITVRVGLEKPDDLDAEAIGWFERAYEENL